MTESVKNLINAIVNGNASETEDAFNAAMAEKVSAKLDDMRMQVAQGMFAQQSQETTTEE
jgi:hypothetical protein